MNLRDGGNPILAPKIRLLRRIATLSIAVAMLAATSCAKTNQPSTLTTVTVTSTAPQTPPRVVATIPHDGVAHGMAIDASAGTIYTVIVEPIAIDGVRVTNIANPESPTTIILGQDVGPSTPAVDPNTHLIYTADCLTNSVSVIDPIAGKVLATIPVPHEYPRHIVLHSNLLYVSSDYGVVDVIDPVNRITKDTIPVGRGPSSMAIDTDRRILYVINYGENTVSVVNLDTSMVKSTIAVGYPPTETNNDRLMDIVVDPRTHLIYVSHGGDTHRVSVIAPDTNTVSAIPVPHSTSGLALDLDSNTLYTGDYMDNTVSAIDLSTRTLTATIAVGERPAKMAMDTENHKLYVANILGGSISVIEPAH